MTKLMVLVAMLSGCSMYFGDDDAEVVGPDAGVVAPTPDAECGEVLPRCFQLGCAVGALTADCPREDDTSVCYCDAPVDAGWCLNH